jgi:hypothetical protein
MATLLGANSIFSYQGLPLANYGYDVYSVGMGSTGSADLFRINTNYTNPAVASNINKVIFSTSMAVGYQWYESANESYRDDGLNFPYFTFAFPVKNHKLGFSFNTYLAGNLETSAEKSWEDEQDNVYNYNETSKISSNVYRADIFYAFKNPYVNFGIAANYYLGHRTSYWEAKFADELMNNKYEAEKEFKNPGFTVGLSKKWEKFSFGISYAAETELEGEYTFKYDHQPYEDLVAEDSKLFTVPARYNASLTYKFTEKYKTSCDLMWEEWDSISASYHNSYQLGLGFAYDPLSGYGKWYEQIPLRTGGYLRKLPFNSGNGEEIWESSFSFGTSIPLKTPGKKIDLAVKYMDRGKVSENNYRDTDLMFHIGITGFDIFKKRYKKTAPREIPQPD